MNKVREQFGQRVAALRRRLDRTQADIAEEMTARLGRSITSLVVSRIENGERPTPVEEMLVLADLLGVRPESILPLDPVESLSRSVEEDLRVTLRDLRTIRSEFSRLETKVRDLERVREALVEMQTGDQGRTEAALSVLAEVAEEGYPSLSPTFVVEILGEGIQSHSEDNGDSEDGSESAI